MLAKSVLTQRSHHRSTRQITTAPLTAILRLGATVVPNFVAAAGSGTVSPAYVDVPFFNDGTGLPFAGVAPVVTVGGGDPAWLTATVVGSFIRLTPDATLFAVAGSGTATLTASDANDLTPAGPSKSLSTGITLTAPATPPLIVASQASLTGFIVAGATSPDRKYLRITNGGGSTPAMGAINVAFSYASGAAWMALVSNTPITGGGADLVIDCGLSTMAAGGCPGTVTITSINASNTPLAVPVGFTVGAFGTIEGPRLASPPLGMTWNPTTRGFDGSIFNVGGHVSAHNYARPVFSGTTYYATTSAQLNGYIAQMAAGTIVDGDLIVCTKGVTFAGINNFPKRPGWVEGTSGFVGITTTGESNLPVYSATLWGRAQRATEAHLPEMPTFSTTTANKYPIRFDQGAGGYWLTGIDLFVNAGTPTNKVVGVLNLSGHVGANIAQGQLAHVPSHIVLDRCVLRSLAGHRNTVGLESTYSAILHSTLQDAFAAGYETKAVYFLNTPGKLAVKGCSLAGWGMTSIVGGGIPSISQIVPTDYDFSYNYCWQDQAHALIDYNQKNLWELKTGIRMLCAFNVGEGFFYKYDQKSMFVAKAADPGLPNPNYPTDPQPRIAAYAAHTTDVLVWCNDVRRNNGKGLLNFADKYSSGAPNGGIAIGCERMEARFNAHQFTYSQISPLEGWNDRSALALYRSQGDGIPGTDISNNTTDGDFCFLYAGDLAAANGTGWVNTRLENNLHISPVLQTQSPNNGQAIFSNASFTPSIALDKNYGVGKWIFRKNFVTPGGKLYDAVLTSAPWYCGVIAQTGAGFTTPYVDRPNHNLRLVPGHPLKGQGTDGRDPGADLDYLEAMTYDVIAN